MKIGLEVHVQLSTKTKLFCGCENKFVSRPNTNVCETCLGFPGSKPRLNERAVEIAMKIGCALGCTFPKEMFFSRKSYFYPDMSKNFQITQYEIPIAKEGLMESAGKKINIRRIQIEEDPARTQHVGGSITKADYVLVDYNRSGTPLVEVVTEPDFASTKEARIFLQELSTVLQYLDAFDPNVEGSMRIDANVSVVNTRVEIKNITGFKDVEKALNYEIVRQNSVIKKGKAIVQETRSWDQIAGVTRTLRIKESENDYGYIFEPDLVKISITKEKINETKAHMPEMAPQKVKRYKKELKIPKELAVSIASEPDLAAMFEAVIKQTDAQLAARWFSGEIKKTLNYNNMRMKDTGITIENMSKLLKMVETKELTDKSAEIIFRKMVAENADPDKFAEMSERISDESVLIDYAKQALEENTKAVLDYKSGKQESFNFLIGQVMRKTQGRGDSEVIRKILENMLNKKFKISFSDSMQSS